VQAINIKLDKSGGLTEALALARAAIDRNFTIMVGCMPGTSLAMAPAFLLGQQCEIVDLDAPLFLAHDRDPRVAYEAGQIWCPPEVWSAPAPANRLQALPGKRPVRDEHPTRSRL